MDDYLGYVGAVSLAAVAAASAVYLASRPSIFETPFPLDDQSRPLTSFEDVRVSRLVKDGKYIRYLYDDVKTLYDVMRRGSRVSGSSNCFGWREGNDKPYQWYSYDQVMKKIKNFGSGLVYKGLKPDPKTFIGIYAQNSPEWAITEYACYSYSMVIVPLYDTLGPEACAYIINQAQINTVICDKDDKINLLLDKADLTPALKCIVNIKPVSAETVAKAHKLGIEIISHAEVQKLGEANHHEAVPPRPSDLSTICYTSGTTGNPKGVMLTHENVVADVAAVAMQLGEHKPGPKDVMISFLPLAHMLERCCEVALIMEGGSIGFYQGDIRLLMDDMQALKPTVTPAVPRLLNRIYDKVRSSTENSFVKRNLLKLALRSKESEISQCIIRNNSLWDKLVFKKVQAGMGGNIRLLVVGSAPLAGNVLTFMRCALGCLVIEGYGQTECVAPCTLTVQGDSAPEHVGPPLPCCGIKLVDVAEMEYFASDGKGEVCVKGYNVFQGYFNDPEKTKDTLDEDGWLHTGDIGMWLPNGTLKIVDRKKHIFKLAQGEYIAPEKIENIYIRSSFVSQIFVHGESLKSCLVAVVVPDPESLKKWAHEKSLQGSYTEWCSNPALKKDILSDLTAMGKKGGLKSFEQVKDVYITSEAFTVDNNLLTPTLKTKRPELKKYFTPQIEAMYRVLA